MSNNITLSAGGGGKAMGELISSLILKHFKNEELSALRDASYLKTPENTHG